MIVMIKRYSILAMAVLAMSGCAHDEKPFFAPSDSELQDRSQLSGADQAVLMGKYQHAERMLAQYVSRNNSGQLRMKYFGISGENRKHAIDTVATLLWETGRDDSLKQFAKDYLSGAEYQTTLCRISERQAKYEEAYHCWNEMGEIDRAERVVRTEAALRILSTP
uniref:Exported protein n=2 Tax=Pseudomonas fluorescens TaxID=294 RepID=A4V7C4_PSEFS|nr:putative exported protein [Pseudomonas fluorescens SBW25]